MNEDKIRQIKILIHSFSEDGLKIWAQHLWEIMCIKDLISDVPQEKQIEALKLRLKIVHDIWNCTGDAFADKVYEDPSWRKCYIADYCGVKNIGKFPWLKESLH
jgi:hypothetical protein